MARNVRQARFVEWLQYMAWVKQATYLKDLQLQQQWQEEFRSTKPNALDTPSDLLDDLALTYSDLNFFVSNGMTQNITFWDGGAALTDVERGKFARRVLSENINLRLIG